MLLDEIVGYGFFFFFKQKTAYEMRISDWSSDVCSSDLASGDFALGLTTLPLAAMVWSAVRFTPMRTSVSAMITVALIAMLAAYGLAGFPRPDGTLETAVLLGYLCLLAILPQALALSVDEHRALTRRLQRRASTDPLDRKSTRLNSSH